VLTAWCAWWRHKRRDESVLEMKWKRCRESIKRQFFYYNNIDRRTK
jgi:hypothetical protein